MLKEFIKKHPCIVNDFWLIYRALGDNGLSDISKFHRPKHRLQIATDKLVAKWSTMQHNGLVLIAC